MCLNACLEPKRGRRTECWRRRNRTEIPEARPRRRKRALSHESKEARVMNVIRHRGNLMRLNREETALAITVRNDT